MRKKTAGKICNVLLTSVGRRVELLRAFRAAYERLNLDGRIIALDIDPLAPAFQLADGKYIVPRHTSSDYIPTLINICRRERADIIFPLIDPDIPLLAKHRQEIEATGARLAVVPLEAARITSDKWETYRFFSQIGVETPESQLPQQVDFPALGYPLFIKPRVGSAAQNTFKVANEEQLRFFINYVPNPIIQEFISGAEITNDVICDLDGEVLSVVSRRRIEVRWGEVAKGVTIYDERIAEACVKIARALRAKGAITIQCMLHDDGAPRFTEINARFGGGAPLGFAAGADAPAWLLARAAGLEIDIPAIGNYQTGLYMTRFDESFFISESQYEQLAGNRI